MSTVIPDFFQVFAKNSLIKNIFEDEKQRLIVERDFFFWKIVRHGPIKNGQSKAA